MTYDERLVQALDGAIRALEELKQALGAQVGGETEEGGAFTFQPTKTMIEAVQAAAAHCGTWIVTGEAGETALDTQGLLRLCQEQDQNFQLAWEDTESYYLVTPEGAVGLTTDGARHIRWLLVPSVELLDRLPGCLI